ncbi:hypothetical protein [Rarobacter faecitabidus]|nr:hypothetical protein [Rarobacter faecitabidus]
MPTAASSTAMTKGGLYDPIEVAHNSHIELSEQQLNALADGEITYDEYQEAAQRMKACADAAGIYFEFMGEENQIIEYRTRSDSDALDAKFNNCYDTEFRALDVMWQDYRANWGPEAGALAECLRDMGEEPRLLYSEKIDQLTNLGIDPDDECINPKLNQGPNATADP